MLPQSATSSNEANCNGNEWWDSVYMCTRNIMNSSGGHVGNLSVVGTPLKLDYTNKWCALI